jgi:hypothetical protein
MSVAKVMEAKAVMVDASHGIDDEKAYRTDLEQLRLLVRLFFTTAH